MPALRIVGPGRAGQSVNRALARAGWRVELPIARGESVVGAARGVDLVLITTPDAVIADVAAQIEPVATTVVAHMAGSRGLDALVPHARPASMHPLRPIATTDANLRDAWWAVAGDQLAAEAVAALGGRVVAVADADRASYHAAAVIASNHLVGLLGQVERVAAEVGVPLAAYLDLVRASVENVANLGPRAALTGPVARGDWSTVARHLDAIPASERAAYEAMADACARLVAAGAAREVAHADR